MHKRLNGTSANEGVRPQPIANSVITDAQTFKRHLDERQDASYVKFRIQRCAHFLAGISANTCACEHAAAKAVVWDAQALKLHLGERQCQWASDNKLRGQSCANT